MKRTGYTIVLSVLVVALWFGRGGQTGGQGADESPCAAKPELYSADANGDGKLDISDPVLILGFLFLGNTPPLCLAAPPNPPRICELCDDRFINEGQEEARIGTLSAMGGKVGIGTTTPTAELEVAGDLQFTNAEDQILFSDDGALSYYFMAGTGQIGMYLDTNANNQGENEVAFTIHNDVPLGGQGEIFTVSGSGNVGIGTTSPQTLLDLYKGTLDTVQPDRHMLRFNHPGVAEYTAGIDDGVFLLEWTRGGLSNFGDGEGIQGLTINSSGHVGIGTKELPATFTVAGDILASGAITQGSSRELKKNIEDLNAKEAVEVVRGLNPVTFEYKADEENDLHVGFIAEDVPELLATPDRKGINSMDVVAVLTKVVQEQDRTIQALQVRLAALEAKG